MTKRSTAVPLLATLLATMLTVAAVAPAAAHDGNKGGRPPHDDHVVCRHYPADRDNPADKNDLLTAGLGAAGLQSSTVPPIVDPLDVTANELRTRAIYVNYRALIDTTAGGGYGSLYGPTVSNGGDANFNTDNGNDGRIPGWECIAYEALRSGRARVTMMVQVPDWFDTRTPCIITAASSGSRGVYGAIGTSGEWGLKQRCAVAYTDKGTGTGAHDLQDNTVNLIDGVRENADEAGNASNFSAPISTADRERLNDETPYRFAFKHAHSRLNPEADWDQNVLASIEFAFKVLARHEIGLDGAYTPKNTIVVASSVSNGAAAGLRALETDRKGLIDGFAGTEPNVNPKVGHPLAIQQGNQEPYTEPGKPLFDYYTIYNVYQGCANIAYPFGTLLNLTPTGLGENVCASLRQKGLLTTDTLADQAAEAQAIINSFGILTEQNIIQPGDWASNVPQGISVTYANSYAETRLEDHLCGYSFGATDGAGSPMALSDSAEQLLFGTSNGIPPISGINLINDNSLDGPLLNRDSKSQTSEPPGRKDQNLDGALCLRSLWTGRDAESGSRLRGKMAALHKELRTGITQILASGDLNGKPALIATGRADQVVAPNHASRAFFGLNQQKEGSHSKLSYIEVTNAQHLDAFNGITFDNGQTYEFGSRYIPLHHYFVQVMNLMFAHLTVGTPLPPSQVVHTTPRGAAVPTPAITLTNVPAIQANPPAADRITYADGVVHIPE